VVVDVASSATVVAGAVVDVDGRLTSEPSTDAGALVAGGGVDTRVGPERCPMSSAAPITAKPPSNNAMPMLRRFATPVCVARMRISTRQRSRDHRSRTLARLKRWSARDMADNATGLAVSGADAVGYGKRENQPSDIAAVASNASRPAPMNHSVISSCLVS
jgi:hypothetical protein